MASYHVAPLARLVEQFESLPGIGHKSAQRLAYYVLGMPKEKAEQFANTVLEARNAIHYCNVCCNLTDQELCPVCRNEERDRSIICVVEDPRDVFALERTNEFHATYHVLHGAISPLAGIGPDQLCIKELLDRVKNPEVKRSNYGNKSDCRRRSNCHVYFPFIKAIGNQSNTFGIWNSRRWRFGICG